MLNASGMHDLAGGLRVGMSDARSSRELSYVTVFRDSKLANFRIKMERWSSFQRFQEDRFWSETWVKSFDSSRSPSASEFA